MKIKKWKEKNWDMWTFDEKVRHVLIVITSIIVVIFFIVIIGCTILLLLGIHGFLLQIRDYCILGFMNYLWGGG